MRTAFYKPRRGFSLIEILLVIGVIAVLAVAAFLIYANVSTAAKVENELGYIRSTATGLRTMFPTTPLRKGITYNLVKQTRILPAAWLTDSPTGAAIPKNAFNGSINFAGRASPIPTNMAPFCSGATPCTQIEISYATTNLDVASCIKLVQGLNELRKTGIIDDFRNGTTIAPAPTDVNVLVSRCNSAPHNTIALYIS